MHEPIGNSVMARIRLRDGSSADREAIALRKVGEVGLVLLDEEVVAAPDRSHQGNSQGTSYRQGHTLLASLRRLFRAQTFSLGQRFPRQARVAARLDHGNQDVVSKLDATRVMPVLISKEPPVH